MKLHKFLLMTALVCLLTALVALPAAADAPVVESGSGDSDTIVDLCPGIEVHEHTVATWAAKGWFDADGVMVKALAEWKGTDSFYNASHPEVVLSGHYAGTYHFQVLGNINMSVGIAYPITIPGYGNVLMYAGADIFTDPLMVVHRGLDTLNNPEDRAVFCAYLAGD